MLSDLRACIAACRKHSGAYVSTAAEEVAWHDNKRATGVPEADTPLWCPLPGCLRSSKLPTAKEGEYKAGDYPLPSFSGAYEHYANIHQASATKEFVCTVEGCTLRFGLEKQLKSHKRSHIEAVSSDTAAACSCGKILASEEALKQHVALVSKRRVCDATPRRLIPRRTDRTAHAPRAASLACTAPQRPRATPVCGLALSLQSACLSQPFPFPSPSPPNQPHLSFLLVHHRVSAHRQPLALQRLCCSIDAHASAAPHRTAAGARLPHFATFAQTIFDVSGAI